MKNFIDFKKIGTFSLFTILLSGGLAIKSNAAPIIEAPSTPVPTRTLVNPSFEYPAFSDNAAWISLDHYIPGDNSTLQGWFSTHPTEGYHNSDSARFKDANGNPFQHLIELWANGHNGVLAADGNQHVELNAQAHSAIYQDILVFQNESILWSAGHRGRSSATVPDVAEISVSDPLNWTEATFNGTKLYSANISTSNDGSISSITPTLGNEANSSSKSDLGDGWVKYSDTWIGPNATKKYRFAFQAVSSGAGDDGNALALGNLLDDIQIKLSPIIDFVDPNITEIYPFGGNSIYYLPIRVNGESQSAATVEIDVALDDSDYTDYSLDTLASGTNSAVANGVTATKLTNGNIQVTIPANLYDPNNPSDYITVPINFDQALSTGDKLAQFTIVNVNGGGGAGVSDFLIPPADSAVYGFSTTQQTTVKGGFPD